MKASGRLPLTESCHHYDHISEVPWDIQKYWHQRYSIFPNYDDNDIQLTDDAWFGVTPEPVATKIASHVATSPHFTSKKTIIDLFAGAGGNAIAFALSGRWDRVLAIEVDAATLACAQHNAEACGVPEGAVTWVHGDCFAYLAALERRNGQHKQQQQQQQQQQGEAAVAVITAAAGGKDDELDEALSVNPATTLLFASPPWGGVSYRDHDVFDLETMQPYNLSALHGACRAMDHALYLPRTSDVRQIARLAPAGDKIDVVQYCMEGASKAMVAYIPGQA